MYVGTKRFGGGDKNTVVHTSEAMKFLSAINAFPFCVKRVMSLTRESISVLFSRCRLINASAPATSLAKSSAVMRACISLHHELHTIIITAIIILKVNNNNIQTFVRCSVSKYVYRLIIVSKRRRRALEWIRGRRFRKVRRDRAHPLYHF